MTSLGVLVFSTMAVLMVHRGSAKLPNSSMSEEDGLDDYDNVNETTDLLETTTTTTTTTPAWTTISDLVLELVTNNSATMTDPDDDVSINVDDIFVGGQFCNKTLTYTVKTECKSCALNILSGCPSGLDQLTKGRGISDCTYSQSLSSDVSLYFAGCRHNCMKTITLAMCCQGYWGADCNDCPGGSFLPCSGHGKCFDGLYGNGTCQCQRGFTGVACELCGSNLYGSDCNKECQCVHGVCDDGINGNGACTCHSGFGGPTCNENLLNCEQFSCPNNTRCVQSESDLSPSCVCEYGFGYDTDLVCQPINRCTGANRPCDQNALCIPIGPALFECNCMIGFEGDGFICNPVDPCQMAAGDCPIDSTKCVFTAPGKRQCSCLDGFQNYTENEGCQLIDVCTINKTLCHSHASCVTTAPWEVECVCETGYVGDGQNCYGNLVERLRDLHTNDVTLKGQFRYALQLTSSIYTDAFTRHGPFTWFLATDSGFEKSLTRREIRDVFGNPEIARQLLRQHVIASSLTLSELTNTTKFYMLEGTAAELLYMNNELKFRLDDFNLKAGVKRGDLIAANGVIHVIDQLLDKPPEIIGSTKKSIYSVLLAEAKYETLRNLLKIAGLMDKLNSSGYYTFFAPNNDAWSNLPKGTLDYFSSTEGKGKLLAVLENHFVEGPYVLAADMINLPRFTAASGIATQVSVTQWGRIKLNGAVNVTQVDIPASNGYIHHIDDLLIPDALLPLLPHRCDVITQRPVRGTCGRCSGDLKCPLLSDIPLNETGNDCRYWMNLGEMGRLNYVAFDGCYRLCNRSYTTRSCCPGFYTESCHSCPGGFQNPCRGVGKCDDGYYGSGSCSCEAKYTGAECEFCAERNSYGTNCTKKCSCLHGTCDNRVSGSIGQCKQLTCEAGYAGLNCDIQLQRCDRRLRLRCHAFADCIRQNPQELFNRIASQITNATSDADDDDDMPRVNNRLRIATIRRSLAARSACRCRQGYRGPGTYCTEINPCLEANRGGCHLQAECIKTGPGQNECRCSPGWVGDGLFCYPSSPCLNHSECHENAICVPSIPNQYVCSCLDGYHGNGTICVLENVCTESNGGCHGNAQCSPAGPGSATCKCKSGFGGDGKTCFSSLGRELFNYPQLSAFSALLQSVPEEVEYLDDITRNFTIFVPFNDAVNELLNSTSSEFWNEESNVQNLLSYHVLTTSMTFDDLRANCQGQKFLTRSGDNKTAIQCTMKDQDVFLNDIAVLSGGLPALNGFIYIINKVLEPRSTASGTGEDMLEQTMSKFPQFAEFLEYLEMDDLTSVVDRLQHYTLFVPLNQSIPINAGRRFFSYFIIPRRLTLYRMKAMNNQQLNTMLGASLQHQLSFANSAGTISINGLSLAEPTDIRTANGIIHALTGSLSPVLNRCDTMAPDSGVIHQCCAGYYGSDCRECPGGSDTPCSGHGVCDEGIHGHGTCKCRPQFSGRLCDICLIRDCSDLCSVNNGGCDETAICQISNDSGEVLCSCPEGFSERDSTCVYTANDCQIANGGCSIHAACIDFVTDLASGSKAEVRCRCEDGFVGDGRTCNGNLWSTLSENRLTAQFYRLLVSRMPTWSEDAMKIVSFLSDPHESFTFFVPNDCDGIQLLTEDELQLYIVNDTQLVLTIESLGDNETVELQTLSSEHLIVRRLMNNSELKFSVNDVVLRKTNIQSTNGVIHILEQPLHVSATMAHSGYPSQNAKSPVSVVFLILFSMMLVGVLLFAAIRYRTMWTPYVQQISLRQYLQYAFNGGRPRGGFGQFYENDILIFNPAADFGSRLNLVTDDNNDAEQQPMSRDDKH